jgi:hypothetical protein
MNEHAGSECEYAGSEYRLDGLRSDTLRAEKKPATLQRLRLDSDLYG